jgi:FkbM family methyltransferase
MLAYPGHWVSRTPPHLGYRVLPKCACSSVGQIIHYLDHGKFYDGDIHEPEAPIHKWAADGDRHICEIFDTRPVFRFTLVRNPYKRLLSSFADKVFGFQINGKRYRAGHIHKHLKDYGVSWGPAANLPANFRAFVRFVADTIERGEPMHSDIHWTPCFRHLQFNVQRAPDWNLDFIGHIEHFKRDIDIVMRRAGIDPSRLPPSIPRENTTSLPPISIQNFYGPEEIEIMQRIYQHDFELFHYSPDPIDTAPHGEIDVAAVNEAFRSVPMSKVRIPPMEKQADEEVIDLNGVKISVDPERFSTKMLGLMRDGTYEDEESRQIPSLLKKGERIVELGAGVGYISALCAKQNKVDSLVVYEAHPELIPVIRRTHELNGVKSTVINAVVLPRKKSDTVPFYIRDDFWASSLSSQPYGYSQVVNVPVVSLAQMIAEHKPTMLIVDIEGGETMLFDDVELPGVRKVYLEVHPHIVGSTAVKRLFDFFADRNFRCDRWRSSNNVMLFTRGRRRMIRPQMVWNRYLRKWIKRMTPQPARAAARRFLNGRQLKSAKAPINAATNGTVTVMANGKPAGAEVATKVSEAKSV